MIKQILDKQVSKASSQLNEVSILTDVKLLLDKESSEDINLLHKAFPASTNVQLLKENSNRVKIKDLQKKHNGNIYTVDELQKICMD